MFTEEIIKDYANKLLFDLTDEEVNDLLNEFDAIKANMEIIANIPNIGEVEPQSFVQELKTDHFREDDEVHNISVEDALANAEKIEDVVIVPKVVG